MHPFYYLTIKLTFMKQYVPILLVGLTGIFSCGKNYTPIPGPFFNVQSALDSALRATNNFKVDAVAGGTFTTNSGAVYSIPPNAFRTGSGGAVTGEVEIKTEEFVSKSDFLFS